MEKSIGKKWRDYKRDLKAMYVTNYKTKDALMKNRPSHKPRDQWSCLISYWLSEKAKVSDSFVLLVRNWFIEFCNYVVPYPKYV